MNSGDGVCARVLNLQHFVVYTITMTSWMIHLCKAIEEEVLVLTIPGGSRVYHTRNQWPIGRGVVAFCLLCKNTSRKKKTM